ncbi:TPA: hypothetical protein DDZ10_00820 [Candidatus Uhrbacteria bacterium]|nr:MAG: hypothetical protein A3D69_00270 [Candidatus Uhrbacteria bacterium RIFCSPHIGHO2_02_FULL_54_11]HBL39197.1 hypothetical protein [Candidatus Uhrbacteria bacterium]
MSKSSSASLWLTLGAVIVAILLVALAISNKGGGGQYDAFAQCLTDQGTKIYSAYWCPNCARQKELFGNSYRLLDDKECAVRGQSRNLTLCQNDGITSVPTWEFGDGERVSGVQPLESLAKRTGCALEGGSASDAREVEEGAASRIEGVEGLDIEVKSDSGITIEGVSATPVVE